MRLTLFIYGFIYQIFQVFMAILERFTFTYEVDTEIASSIFNNLMRSITELSKESENNCDKNVVFEKKIKIGLLTNEIPPVVYGGVATWIVNFIKMFECSEYFEVYPIFLAHLDNLPE